MNRLEIFQEVYGKDYMFIETELNRLHQVAELIVQESCYKLMEMHEKVNGDHNYYHHASVQLKQHFGSRVDDES